MHVPAMVCLSFFVFSTSIIMCFVVLISYGYKCIGWNFHTVPSTTHLAVFVLLMCTKTMERADQIGKSAVPRCFSQVHFKMLRHPSNLLVCKHSRSLTLCTNSLGMCRFYHVIEKFTYSVAALGLRASKDNFWSGSQSTDRGRESSPYLNVQMLSIYLLRVCA